MLLISQDGGKMVHLPVAALRVVMAEDVIPEHKSRLVKGFFTENPDGCAVIAYQGGQSFTMGIYKNYGDGMDVIRAVATAYSDGKDVFYFPDVSNRGGYGFIDLPDQDRGDGTTRRTFKAHFSTYPGGEGEP